METLQADELAAAFTSDPEKKFFPRFIYKRLKIEKPIERFFYKIDFSSGYFLRRLLLKCPSLMKDPYYSQWFPMSPMVPNALYYPSQAWQDAHRGTNLILRLLGGIGNTGAFEPNWNIALGSITIDAGLSWLSESAYQMQCPKLKIEFIDNAHFLNRQLTPMQAELIGTPGTDGAFLIEAPAPVDNDGYGLNWNVPHPPSSTATLNFLYKYGDVMQIVITGQKLQPTQKIEIWTPNFIDLLLCGYYLPTGTLENR